MWLYVDVEGKRMIFAATMDLVSSHNLLPIKSFAYMSDEAGIPNYTTLEFSEGLSFNE